MDNSENENLEQSVQSIEEEYKAFHSEVFDATYKFRRDFGEFQIFDFDLDKLIKNEQSSLIEAFVNLSGNIEKEYSITQKIYLKVLEKISEKLQQKAKSKIDDKIIKKCAENKLNMLEKFSAEIEESADTISAKRTECSKIYFKLRMKADSELANSKRLRKMRQRCQNYIFKLNKERDAKLEENGEDNLSNVVLEALEDLDYIRQNYKKTNSRIAAIQDNLNDLYPELLQIELYSDLLQDEVDKIKNMHLNYTRMYENSKQKIPAKLKELQTLHEEVKILADDHTKRVDENAQQILKLIGNNRQPKDLASWEDALASYKQATDSIQDNFSTKQETEQEKIRKLEIKYNSKD